MHIGVEGVSYTYLLGTPQEKTALHDISINVGEGACLAIAGVSGSGKSTLAQLMAGLLRPSRGRITANGVPIAVPPRRSDWLRWLNRTVTETEASIDAATALRKRIGYAFQYPEMQLFEETVEADIAFGLRELRLRDHRLSRRIYDALELVGLDPSKYAQQRPRTLSGGEQRRVALAGILVMQPEVLILDEPTAGLDGRGRREIEQLLRTLHSKQGMTLVLISHDLEEVSRLADRLVVLRDGQIVLEGGCREVLAQPAALRAAGLAPTPLVELAERLEEDGLLTPADAMTAGQAAQAIIHKLQPPIGRINGREGGRKIRG